MLILEWLGIIILVSGILYWSFKGKKTGQCCSGCDSCPLQNRCEKTDVGSESGV